jgi:hypothetical protein
MKSVNWPKPGYAGITCSAISNIPYNLIFTTKFNDIQYKFSTGSLSHGQLFHVSIFSIDLIKEKNTIKTYMQVVLSHYTSISSKTDKISKCVVLVRSSAPFRHWDSNYYLFRASSCPQVLKKDTIAMTGV